jgi:wyosine [tRNA(Phe)-imidazoG37] synthetase (radical SAM superfamily)
VRLTTKVHDRDAAGMTYVYAVVSRRARGVSIGVNLNTNNACNWRCVYCQVPGLTFGKAPEVDLELYEAELRRMLATVTAGDFLERAAPAGARRLNDVAFSGNGEPTSSPRFREAVELALAALGDFGLLGKVKVVVITNGSLIHQPEVAAALRAMAPHGGEVWYKLDSATEAGAEALNSSRAGVARAAANLRLAAASCTTWIQTMALARNGAPPSPEERAAYLALVGALAQEGVPLAGVHLYGLERQSHQPEASELAPLPRAWLEQFAEEIRARGLRVEVSP